MPRVGDHVSVVDQKSTTTRRVTVELGPQGSMQFIREEGHKRVTIRRYEAGGRRETNETVEGTDLILAVEKITERFGEEQ